MSEFGHNHKAIPGGVMRREKVILRRCPDYNPQAVAGIIREGIEEFGLAPRLRGRGRGAVSAGL